MRLSLAVKRALLAGLLGVLVAPVPSALADDECRQVAPPPPATINLGFFGRNIPMLAAQKAGFYAAENLTVQEFQIANSVQGFRDLRDNRFQFILTSIDNVVNFRVNPHNALGAIQAVTSTFGVDFGANLTMVGRLGITSIQDLRGKTIGVDAPDSGFAFAIYKILRVNGLERGVDYTVVSIGGTATRFNVLMAGNVDATLLNNGFEIRAADAGRPILATIYDVASPYMGSVGAAMEGWLATHAGIAERFIRAYFQATLWTFDPANREAAIALLMTQPNTPRAIAEQIYAAHLIEGRGLIEETEIDRDGILTVVQLRDEFGGFESPQDLEFLTTRKAGIFNLRFSKAAIRGLECDDDDLDSSWPSVEREDFADDLG